MRFGLKKKPNKPRIHIVKQSPTKRLIIYDFKGMSMDEIDEWMHQWMGVARAYKGIDWDALEIVNHA